MLTAHCVLPRAAYKDYLGNKHEVQPRAEQKRLPEAIKTKLFAGVRTTWLATITTCTVVAICELHTSNNNAAKMS